MFLLGFKQIQNIKKIHWTSLIYWGYIKIVSFDKKIRQGERKNVTCGEVRIHWQNFIWYIYRERRYHLVQIKSIGLKPL